MVDLESSYARGGTRALYIISTISLAQLVPYLLTACSTRLFKLLNILKQKLQLILKY